MPLMKLKAAQRRCRKKGKTYVSGYVNKVHGKRVKARCRKIAYTAISRQKQFHGGW